MDRFLVGSTYFFKGKPEFESKDTDYVILVDSPRGFKYVRQISTGSRCTFEWKRMSANEFVEYALHNGDSMQVGKFLVPEFIEEVEFTLNHLRKLKPLFDRLDKKHLYEKVIYEAYLENGEFHLTDEQLETAYLEYKKNKKKTEN